MNATHQLAALVARDPDRAVWCGQVFTFSTKRVRSEFYGIDGISFALERIEATSYGATGAERIVYRLPHPAPVGGTSRKERVGTRGKSASHAV